MLTVRGISRINFRLKINNLDIISNIDSQVVTSSKAVALHNLLQLPKIFINVLYCDEVNTCNSKVHQLIFDNALLRSVTGKREEVKLLIIPFPPK